MSFSLPHRITFYGLVDGEVWYQLNLEGLNPKETYIPHVECEIGRYEGNAIWVCDS